jgi:hypothetical protein
LRLPFSADPESVPADPDKPLEELVSAGALSVTAASGLALPEGRSSLLPVASDAGCSPPGTSIGRDGGWTLQFWECTLS